MKRERDEDYPHGGQEVGDKYVETVRFDFEAIHFSPFFNFIKN